MFFFLPCQFAIVVLVYRKRVATSCQRRRANGKDKGSIVFDRPHPEPVVDAVMLRHAVGKRLADAFQWDADTFVLRKKEVESSKAD